MAKTQGTTEVDLTELGIISRFSLAVRAPRADRDELVALLLEDVAWLQSLPATSAPAARAVPERVAETFAEVEEYDDTEYDAPDEDFADPAGTYEQEPEVAPAPRRRAAPGAVKAPAKAAKAPAKAAVKAVRRTPSSK